MFRGRLFLVDQQSLPGQLRHPAAWPVNQVLSRQRVAAQKLTVNQQFLPSSTELVADEDPPQIVDCLLRE
jgi:hypothetical protein